MEMEVYLQPFVTLALDRGKWSAPLSGPYDPSTNQHATEKIKIPATTLKWIQINQPAACHYTDSAILDISPL
jgi:hypothetical protein